MSISGNRYLSMAEMKINAYEIWERLFAEGWTINAVAGVLGNMQSESSINPGIWESLDAGNLNGGYSLVQWTPASKYIDWANARGQDPSQLETALDRIVWEVENDVQWGYSAFGEPPPYDFYTFTQSMEAPSVLAMYFIRFYERPADVNQPWRGTQADFWYEYLTGEEPPNPPDPPISRKKMPIYMMLRPF